MNQEQLYFTARSLMCGRRGLLDLDDTHPELQSIFAGIAMAASELRRGHFRDLLLDSSGLDRYVAGVILEPETLLRLAGCHTHEVYPVHFDHMLVGIAADCGTTPLPESSTELLTDGVEGLELRLRDWRGLGVRFAQWESVFLISEHGLPSRGCVQSNADRQALFVSTCQELGIVPVISFQLSLEEDVRLDTCKAALELILHRSLEALETHDAWLKGLLVRLPFLTPGAGAGSPPPDEQLVEETLTVLQTILPPELGGILLRAGSLDLDRAENCLRLLRNADPVWPMGFALGQSVQREFAHFWQGKRNLELKAQLALLARLREACQAIFPNEIASGGSV